MPTTGLRWDAQHANPVVRAVVDTVDELTARLYARADGTPGWLLSLLASHPSVRVRLALSGRPALPRPIVVQLLCDPSRPVTVGLATHQPTAARLTVAGRAPLRLAAVPAQTVTAVRALDRAAGQWPARLAAWAASRRWLPNVAAVASALAGRVETVPLLRLVGRYRDTQLGAALARHVESGRDDVQVRRPAVDRWVAAVTCPDEAIPTALALAGDWDGDGAGLSATACRLAGASQAAASDAVPSCGSGS